MILNTWELLFYFCATFLWLVLLLAQVRLFAYLPLIHSRLKQIERYLEEHAKATG